jgi:TrmH family RNA methyltransferase
MEMSKNRKKLVMRLRNPRFRPREGLFLVEGVKGSREVLRASPSLSVRFAMVSPKLESTLEGEQMGSLLSQGSIPMERISEKEMGELADTRAPQGLILVVEEPAHSLGDLERYSDLRLLLLDGIQDPGNAGTLIRSARALGAQGILALEGTVDLWNPKVVRSTAGAFAHIPLLNTPWSMVAEWLGGHGIPLLVADPRGEDARSFRPPPSWALALGNEGGGLRKELLTHAEKTLAIPMVPGADSLNAGVAGSILLFALTSSLDTDGEA